LRPIRFDFKRASRAHKRPSIQPEETGLLWLHHVVPKNRHRCNQPMATSCLLARNCYSFESVACSELLLRTVGRNDRVGMRLPRCACNDKSIKEPFNPSTLRLRSGQARRSGLFWLVYLAQTEEGRRDHIRAQVLRLRTNGLS